MKIIQVVTSWCNHLNFDTPHFSRLNPKNAPYRLGFAFFDINLMLVVLTVNNDAANFATILNINRIVI